MKTQLAAVGGRRGGELADGLDDRGQLLVVDADAGVQLVQALGRHALACGEVSVEEDALTAQYQNAALDVLVGYEFFRPNR